MPWSSAAPSTRGQLLLVDGADAGGHRTGREAVHRARMPGGPEAGAERRVGEQHRDRVREPGPRRRVGRAGPSRRRRRSRPYPGSRSPRRAAQRPSPRRRRRAGPRSATAARRRRSRRAGPARRCGARGARPGPRARARGCAPLQRRAFGSLAGDHEAYARGGGGGLHEETVESPFWGSSHAGVSTTGSPSRPPSVARPRARSPCSNGRRVDPVVHDRDTLRRPVAGAQAGGAHRVGDRDVAAHAPRDLRLLPEDPAVRVERQVQLHRRNERPGPGRRVRRRASTSSPAARSDARARSPGAAPRGASPRAGMRRAPARPSGARGSTRSRTPSAPSSLTSGARPASP